MNEKDRALLLVVMSDEEAVLIAGALRSEGIDVFIDSRTFKQEPVRFGLLGDVKLYVCAADEERARELLGEIEESAADYDPEAGETAAEPAQGGVSSEAEPRSRD